MVQIAIEHRPAWRMADETLAWLGRLLLASGSAALCLVSLIEARLPAAFDSANAPPLVGLAVSAAGLLVAFIALAELNWFWNWSSLAAFWAIGAAAAVPLSSAAGLTGWVPASECLVLACAALLLVARPHSWTDAASLPAAVLACAAMLALFGAIHWSNAPDIAALIPAWIPRREALPIVTATIMLAAAAAILLPPSRSFAALAVATMFTTWIALVHVARLLATPTSSFEWEFACMAACLTGAFLVVGTRGRAR